MSVVVSNDGVNLLTRSMLNQAGFPTLVCRLFKNNLAPTYVTPLSSFVELSYPDYAPKTLTPAYWHGGATADASSYTYPTLTWEFAPFAGPSDTLYGYFVTDVARSVWLWCEQLLTPPPIPNSGWIGQLNLVVQLQGSSGP